MNRILINVPHMVCEILKIAYQVIMKRFLPDCGSYSFGNKPLKLLDDPRHCRGDHWSPAFIGTNPKQNMDVIWHNHIIFN